MTTIDSDFLNARILRKYHTYIFFLKNRNPLKATQLNKNCISIKISKRQKIFDVREIMAINDISENSI